jgi:hypothetical protein
MASTARLSGVQAKGPGLNPVGAVTRKSSRGWPPATGTTIILELCVAAS